MSLSEVAVSGASHGSIVVTGILADAAVLEVVLGAAPQTEVVLGGDDSGLLLRGLSDEAMARLEYYATALGLTRTAERKVETAGGTVRVTSWLDDAPPMPQAHWPTLRRTDGPKSCCCRLTATAPPALPKPWQRPASRRAISNVAASQTICSA